MKNPVPGDADGPVDKRPIGVVAVEIPCDGDGDLLQEVFPIMEVGNGRTDKGVNRRVPFMP